MKRDWQTYFELTKSKPPRGLLVEALTHVSNRGHALDLGAGALNDSLFLLKEEFEHVTAVDREALAQTVADKLPSEKFTYTISKIENFEFPSEKFDLVNAQYALPFVSPESFDEVLEKIGGSIKRGGIFTGQLFGDRDEWRTHADMTFQTEDKTRKLLSDFDLLFFKEDEADRPTAEGTMKHWHVFHFIVRK